jgi:hypothetical protein
MLYRAVRRLERHALGCLLAAASGACAPKPLPDPRVAAQRWQHAVEKGDASAAYALLDTASQRDHGRAGVARLIAAHAKELESVANAAASDRARLSIDASVRYAGERSARVAVEDGRYRVASLGALPARATDPADALRELREVLSRRSFAGLLRVLTRESGQTLERSVTELVTALDEAETIEIEVEGRRAVARLPGGHSVTLERQDGVWRVKDFD